MRKVKQIPVTFMDTVTVLCCDNCGREQDQPNQAGWWTVRGRYVTETDHYENAFDVCSVKCAEALLSKHAGEPALATD